MTQTDPAPDSARGRLEDALDRLRLPARGYDATVAEATRRATAEREARTQAEEVYAAAVRRYNVDALVAMRVKLAVRVVETLDGLDDGQRDAAYAAAVVALELVERDRDTAEAKLARARALAADWLTQASPAPQAAARLLLDAIGDPT